MLYTHWVELDTGDKKKTLEIKTDMEFKELEEVIENAHTVRVD
jgi:hypothetical protein